MERTEPCEEHAPISNLAYLFGPCSLVRRSLTPSILASLATACTSTDSVMREDICDVAESLIDKRITEVAERMLDAYIHQKLPSEQAFEVPCGTSTAQILEPPLQVISVEYVVLVEDASDDEEAILDAQVTIKDPILLITIEDSSTQSTIEIMAQEPQQLEDPLIEDESSPTAVVRKGEDLACTPTLPPSTPTTKTRRRHKSYDRSSLCRSARIANHGVLKNLGIVGNDGKCNEDAIQDYADCRVVTARRPQAFDEFKRSCLLGPCGGDCFTCC